MQFDYFRWPTTNQERDQIALGFVQKPSHGNIEDGLYIPNVIGAVDGTLVKRADKNTVVDGVWNSRKLYAANNVLGIVDADGKFLYVCIFIMICIN